MLALAVPTRPPDLIIVIDDDPAVLNSLKFSLEVEGFVVKVFLSGEELFDSRPLPNAGCLVVDYELSSMDGLSVVAELRQRNIDLPAILISSNPPPAVRRRAAEAGLAIVEKPLFGNALIEAIGYALHSGHGTG